jgi:thioredoxin reductase
MSNLCYDIIIIGSGMAGLYSAYNIKKMSPNTSFLILEKYKKQWIGGRTSNEMFYGTEIFTGAGIGRRKKDKLLYKLLKELHIPTYDFILEPNYSKTIVRVSNIDKTMNYLKNEFNKQEKKNDNKVNLTFKQFAKKMLGEKEYQQFLITTGYTDYENEDVYDTLYHYGMEDNDFKYKAFHVEWKEMVLRIADKIGYNHFKFSSNVVSFSKNKGNSYQKYQFEIQTENNDNYYCNKIIIATTISSIRKLLPQYPIYHDIEGQPFLRLYGKFSKNSTPIMKEYVKGLTIVPGPLQKIIPVDSDKGIYMIAYSDNLNAITLKNHLENSEQNRALYCNLLEQTLGIPTNSLHLIAIKDYYWPIGTHYYKPLNKNLYTNRQDFIEKTQHPENCILVVGEVVSNNQGWTEGALESVKSVLTKKWIL